MTATRPREDCFSTCVYMSVLLLGILLFLIGIALIAVAYVAFMTRNSMFFVLGVIMIVSALAVIIVAFYIRLRILGDMDEEARYGGDHEDSAPPIDSYVPSASSVLARAYAPDECPGNPSGGPDRRRGLPVNIQPPRSESGTPSPTSSHSDLIERRSEEGHDFVYENPVALADEASMRLSSVVPAPVHMVQATSSPERPEPLGQSDDVMRTQDIEAPSPTFTTPPTRLSDRPPSYSDHWQLPLRQESVTSANNELPPSYEESLHIPAASN